MPTPKHKAALILPVYLEKTLNTQRNQLGDVVSDTDSEIDVTGGALLLNGGLGASCKLSQNAQLQLNLEYRRLHVEFVGNRIFDSNMLVCSADLLF